MDERQKVRGGQFNLRLKVGLSAAAFVGLLLAVAGTTPAAIAEKSPAARIVLELPAWLSIPFVVLLCLTALYIALLMVTGVRPRVKRPAARNGSALMLLLLLIVGAPFWPELSNRIAAVISDLLASFGQMAGSPAALAEPGAEIPADAAHSALVGGILETWLLALTVIAFGILAWLFLGILPQRSRDVPPPVPTAALQAAVEESLDDLRHLPDARLAIIRCYARFEKVLAGAEVRRSPWETAMEFMRRALSHPRLPREDVRQLTSLFELARFSRHEMGPGHRERAWQALMAVKAALDGGDAHAAAT